MTKKVTLVWRGSNDGDRMTEHSDSIALTLVPAPGTDRACGNRLTHALAQELHSLRIDSLEHGRGEPASGERSATLTDLETLVVAGVLSGSGLKAMITLVQSWLRRNDQDSVLVELDGDRVEITGSPTRRSHQIQKDFCRRHGEPE